MYVFFCILYRVYFIVSVQKFQQLACILNIAYSTFRSTMQLQSVPGEEDQDFDVLPVESFKEAILHHLRSSVHQVLICVGETGSGKTTKIPQIVLDSGILGDLGIAVTQPRRVGAMTVSQRVASERGGRLGEQVGYRVRFDDRTGPDTRIFFLTDGILVNTPRCYFKCW